jgi:4-hydroxy-3-polyprenylbenzoate decarboxylase
LAIAFGLAPETTPREIQAEYERRMEQLLKPVVLKDGPCKENVLLEDEVDLFHFPVPLEHEGDGNRCIGSWHAVVAKDPDSDWTNWGMYRQMVHNRRYIGGHWHHATDAAYILHNKFAPQGKPMPVAIAIGLDPMCCLAAIAPLRVGVSEVDYAGGLRGEPVDLVKCETSDLLVPANAEIVIEGEILPDTRVPSGPFGDFTAHEVIGPDSEVCRVRAITHRHNPILTLSHLGLPTDDNTMCLPFAYTIPIKRALQGRGIPVTDVYLPPEGLGLVAIIGVKKSYSTVADHVFTILDSTQPGLQHIVVVVDEDVDVFNWHEVMHAFATKMHPARDIRVNSHRLVTTLLANLSPEDRKLATNTTTRGASVLFDCTTPLDWSRETDVLPRIAFRDTSPEIRDKVLAKWKSYGFK